MTTRPRVIAFDAQEAEAAATQNIDTVTINCGTITEIFAAKAFGDVGTIRKQLNAERRKALSRYRAAVMDGSFPDAATSVSMSPHELD